ncbi:MAG: TatD family hydrolase [Crocinitomicaceae bacterium]|nr:TatD family hydrolase [Crocinitomicaceae bacterium]
MIDTHAHIYSDSFSEDRAEVIKRAIDAGVEKILLPNIDFNSLGGMDDLVNTYPNIFYPMLGLHPCEIKENWEQDLERLKSFYRKGYHVAIGEIGVDLYWDVTFKEHQMRAFAMQIDWAKEFDLPIVIHARDSFKEIFKVLDEYNDESLTGVFHCFTGGEEEVEKILEYGGFMFGIGGVVTFKNSGLDKVLGNIPLSAVLLETDAPYLAPAPKRGKRNEPALLPLVVEKIAAKYSKNKEDVIAQTTKNALKLFNL